MDEQRIGTNAAVAVQVCEFHEPNRQNDNLAENEDEFARKFFWGSAPWRVHVERGQDDVNLRAEFIHTVKTPVGLGIGADDMIAVVGKLFARGKAGRFTDDLVSLGHEPGAVGVSDDPFST